MRRCCGAVGRHEKDAGKMNTRGRKAEVVWRGSCGIAGFQPFPEGLRLGVTEKNGTEDGDGEMRMGVS